MVFIIAECAQGYYRQNIEESIELAKMLVRVAKSSGADAVKFQLVLADELSTCDYKYYELFVKLELGFKGWESVCDIANDLGIEIIFDVFGIQSLKIAELLGVKTIKIHPTDFRNEILLESVSNSSKIKNVLAGCGGSLPNEIIETLKKFNNKKFLTLFHGFQGYPTPLKENCLNRIDTYKKLADSIGLRNYAIGFADHSDPLSLESNHLSIMAIGKGVTVLEKHLTLSRCLNLEDNESALSPDEFKNFVDNIRKTNIYLGSQQFTEINFSLPPQEIKYRNSCVRHVVAANDLKAGQIIKDEDIFMKRSSTSEPITDKNSIIGKVLVKDISMNQYLSHSDFE